MHIGIYHERISDRAEYLGEMLALWGGSFYELMEPAALSGNRMPTVLIVPGGSEPDSAYLRSILEQGRHLILIAPSPDTLQALGLDIPFSYINDDRVAHLRLAEPLLETFSHHGIPVVGRRLAGTAQILELPLPKPSQVLAWLYEPGPDINDRPGIWTMPVGAGRLTVFGYDLVECFRDLRQGFKSHADWRPGSEVHARPCDLFGPEWESRFPATHLPLADFHAMLLLRLVEQSVDVPLPRFWQLPGLDPSVALISGDEDCADPAYNEQICSFLDGMDGHMVIYLQMPGSTSTRQQLEDWMVRGHRFSVHPFPVAMPEGTARPLSELLKELEVSFNQFRQRFELPTRTVRNHRLFWVGYMDVPKLWERLGVEMDCNYGYNSRIRGFNGFFSTPAAALPMRFLDAEFRTINVLQQPCHLGDDACFHPSKPQSRRISPQLFETYTESLLAGTLEPLGVPFAVCFHPVNYGTFAGDAERRFLTRAKAHGSRLMSDYDWLDFWKMRRSWRLTGITGHECGFDFCLEGQVPSRDLSLSLPAYHHGHSLHQVTVDKVPLAVRTLKEFHTNRVLAALPDGLDHLTLQVTYA